MKPNPEKKTKICDGNKACVNVAYRLTDLSVIYPITPSTPMGELYDEWASQDRKNIWGTTPHVSEMQSEGGASGALHGSLQAGALATTFTSSQGLLLMIPNMYKIAGELTPAVMHVAARSLATHALSIFGDHSDVMAVRSTGWGMLSSGSVQEAHDMAAIAHMATLESRLPFLHFFDGFRVSHEINKIEYLSDDSLRLLIDDNLIFEHRSRALSPEKPFIRGTSQNPDVFFQERETVNNFYSLLPEIVTKAMEKFSAVTNRKYSLMDYYGDPNATRVLVIMGAGAHTARETVKYLNAQGEKVGVLQVRLFRPFSIEFFLKSLPKTVRSIAVLDRCKENGAIGEPLYQDVVTAVGECLNNGTAPFAKEKMPLIIGGRFGLGSKEFTPMMVKAVFEELKKSSPKNHFTIGINDDVSKTSLSYENGCDICDKDIQQAIFYGLGADGTVSANKNTIKIIGENTDLNVQAYFVYDSKKSYSQTTSHLRFGSHPIVAPYLIQAADFVGCHQFSFIDRINLLEEAKIGATFLLNSPFGKDEVWRTLPRPVQESIINKKLRFYVIDAYKVAREVGLEMRINTVMQVCFFALSKIIPLDLAITKIKTAIEKTYGDKGKEVVDKNFKAVDQALANLAQVAVPKTVDKNAREMLLAVSPKAPAFVQKVTAKLMQNLGDGLPVSAFPCDGTYPSGTSKWEKRNLANFVADWDKDQCIACGQCSLICPHSVIRAKRYAKDLLKGAPAEFKYKMVKSKDLKQEECFTLQIGVEDCTGCGLCTMVCPAKSKDGSNKKAIALTSRQPLLAKERQNIEFFETLPNVNRDEVMTTRIPDVQYLEPLFEFSGACAGCGETPYLKLLSQLYGDHLLIANATGCSSIYGGNLPTTPWTCNKDGFGPAWSNSLFEDNAEFGFGFALAHEQHLSEAIKYLNELNGELEANFVKEIIANVGAISASQIAAQRGRIKLLREKLATSKNPIAKHLSSIADNLIKRSVWLVGGDGWAYDIGYGGLDHVLAQNRKINALVLDTEVYSNTGGQSSKATPLGAVAKFAASGKKLPRKDLGLMMMSYGNIYVAQVALAAQPVQALLAFKEAEEFPGPSIIIAYCHCISHGYSLKNAPQQQKLAVASGAWPLFRYNPSLQSAGKNPFQLDSPGPSVPLQDYMYKEARFRVLLDADKAAADKLLKEAEEEIARRWALYKKLAT